MNLNERYYISARNKTSKRYRIFIILVLLLLFSLTLARYNSTSTYNSKMSVAKWCIKINDVEITQNTKKLSDKIEFVAVENKSEDDLIKAGQKGYFEINIDPQYTEVSLNYSIVIDTSQLPVEIELTKYAVNDFDTKIDMPSNNILTGDILLDGKTSLEDTDAKTYRIYWEWADEDNIIDIKNYKLKANIIIKQEI